VKVHLFAKAKELAGGRNCIVCSLETDDASISVQDFLERYVFRVSIFCLTFLSPCALCLERRLSSHLTRTCYLKVCASTSIFRLRVM
jgi:hypothetical protein